MINEYGVGGAEFCAASGAAGREEVGGAIVQQERIVNII